MESNVMLKDLIKQRNALDEQIKEIKNSELLSNDFIQVKRLYNCKDEFMHYSISVKRYWRCKFGAKRFYPIADADTEDDVLKILNKMIERIKEITDALESGR